VSAIVNRKSQSLKDIRVLPPICALSLGGLSQEKLSHRHDAALLQQIKRLSNVDIMVVPGAETDGARAMNWLYGFQRRS
jgi:hypothetical protein